MILSPLLLAGTLTAQIPSAAEQLRRIADVTATVRNEYVDELDEAFLAARCIKSMDEHLGERKPQPAPPAPDAKPIERIAEYWRQAAPGDAEGRRALGDACLRGMVNDLDRLTEYLDRGKFNDLRGIAVGGMGGLGLEVEMRDGVLTVVEPLENTPGARMGLRRGDRLIDVDGAPTAGLRLPDAVKLMRGKPGSTVVLTVERDGARTRMEGVRQIIRVRPVRAVRVADGALHVRISQFSEATLGDFFAALDGALREPGGLPGVVLDLRGNSGGLLQSCVGVSAIFLPETALVVETKGRTEQSTMRFLARPQDYARGGRERPQLGLAEVMRKTPLVLLVDRRSAACSEVVAGAMQDHKRAQVIGERTFGAGTVQTIIPLAGVEALRLTTSRFYRPGGGEIENKGVTPDLEVAHPELFRGYGQPDDPALPAALQALPR